jgi:centrosomal protein CEP76
MRDPGDDEALAQADQSEKLSWDEKLRTWELSLSLRAFDYVGNMDKRLTFFFSVKVGPESERVKRGKVRLITEFTRAWTVQKGRTRDEQHHTDGLDPPLMLYDRKSFQMSYKNLHRHVLKVGMWKFSMFTYNSFYASGKKSLAQLAMTEASMEIKLKQNVTQAEKEENMKKSRKYNPPDVAIFCCTCLFEEVFDFRFYTENWTFEPSKGHSQANMLEGEKKGLTFFMPKNYKSDASSKKACWVRKTGLSKAETVGSACRYFWSNTSERHVDTLQQEVKFRGTQSALQGSYFIVALHTKAGVSHKVIGRAMFCLTSVLDIPVFKGKLKTLEFDPEREADFIVGSLNGTARTVERSIRVSYAEDIPGGRPRQPRSERTVNNMNKKEMRLVVRVFKAEGLAVGDANTGSSDPYVRIIWDNMCLRSVVMRQTLRPVFNQSFYFPVRFFDTKVMQPKYEDKVLPLELESKGAIKIQLWDDEGTSADYLGGAQVELKNMLNGKPYEQKSLLGDAGPMSDDEEENAPKASSKKRQWFEKAKYVRVYDGSRTEVEGCSLPKSAPTFIHFEAYFYPDNWPEEINFENRLDDDDAETKTWNDRADEFDRLNAKFADTYGQAFPDSIGGMPCRAMDASSPKVQLRRFPCVVQHPQSRHKVPLMAFLARITTPQEYSTPPVLLHWMNCMTFFTPKIQENTGMIPSGGWKDPQTMLSARKGPVQDHALLLCSILLGSGHDAYVCKGTIQGEGGRLAEHCWVMTRDTEKGWVTFWEPCTRETYHLPKRVTKQISSDLRMRRAELPEKSPPSGDAAHDDEDDNDEEQARMRADVGEAASYEVYDRRLFEEDMAALPSIGRVPRANVKAKAKQKGRDKEREHLKRQRNRLLQAPNRKLLKHDTLVETLVDWLPYDSIEVVFNRENLWANHQNHHPAAIMYDLEGTDKDEEPTWLPFLSEKDKCDPKHKIEYLCQDDVMMDPELKLEQLAKIEQEMESELRESIRLFRSKNGRDTNWDPDRDGLIRENVTSFLTIHEDLRKLDKDFSRQSESAQRIIKDVTQRYGDAGMDIPNGEITDGLLRDWLRGRLDDQLYRGGEKRKDSKAGSYRWVMNQLGGRMSTNNKLRSAFLESTKLGKYAEEQKMGWDNLFDKVRRFRDDSKAFPAKKGKLFRGFPLHFNTSVVVDIVQLLMRSAKYRKDILENDQDDGLLFSVHCKIFGQLGGVQSTWLYFGLQEPLDKSSRDAG